MLCLLYTMYIQSECFYGSELKSKLDYMTSVALANAKKKELLKKIWTRLKEC